MTESIVEPDGTSELIAEEVPVAEQLPPQTWPEGTEAPPEEFTHWLSAVPFERRVQIVTKLLASSQEAGRCWAEDHIGYRDHLEARLATLRDEAAAARRKNIEILAEYDRLVAVLRKHEIIA